MRKLLLFFAMLCVSIGTWAQSTIDINPNATVTISADGKTAVFQCTGNQKINDVPPHIQTELAGVEKFVISDVSLGNNFKIENYPALKELVMEGINPEGAITIANNSSLTKVVITPTAGANVTFTNNSSLTGIVKNSLVTTDATFAWTGTCSTFTTIEPVNYTQPAYRVIGKTALKITGTMSTDDVANLDLLSDMSGEIRLLDMFAVTLSGTVSDYDFPFAGNNNLVSVVLPKGLPDAKAEWFTGCTNLYSAITYNSGVTELKAYINKPGSLKNTIMDFGYEDAYEQHGNWLQTDSELGSQSLTNGYAATQLPNTITSVKISGTFNNNDIGGYSANYDENGHITFDHDNVEYYNDQVNAIGGGVGSGALQGGSISTLDLTDAIPQIPTDLRLAAHGNNYKNLTTLRLPTSASVKIIPRDFLNADALGSAVKTLCIPMNFEVIGARAFSTRYELRHIYTTGTQEDIRYDNGAVTAASVDSEGEMTETTFYGEDVVGKDVLYGSITLSSNVKVIESYAFSKQENIKDVYVLAQTAPECHVDAFYTVPYVANDAYDTSDVQKKGIITRSAYRNGMTKDDSGNITQPVKWMAVLHYPRECTTPDIQRYTDVTRDYSVATGMRDGKGATLYFPSQSEYYRAFLQGTFGYVWDAWDTTRSTDGNNAVISPDLSKTFGHWQAGGQQAANDMYIANTDAAKTDRSFYDVTLGDDNTSTLSKPAGLQDYWNVSWQGTKLYPKAQTVVVTDDQGNTVYHSVQATDENGNLQYDLDNNTPGEYVKVVSQEYVQNSSGNLVKDYKYVEQSSMPDYNEYVATGKAYRLYNGEYITLLSDPEHFNWPATGWYLKEEMYRDEDLVNHPEDANATHYSLETVESYRKANAGEAGDRYTPRMVDVPLTQVTKANDYRGWHQFVLAAYAHNSTVDIRPYRSYITDSEWWTICMPFDLTKSEIEMIYGGNGLPYVSKLTHVIRDIKNQRITLMFSNNLMEYKETVASGKVHGVISTNKGGVGDDDVVIHKGVPYLIRPNLKDDATRQFDFKPGDRLHAKLVEEAELSGDEQKARIYAGEYTVPAFVINDEDGLESVESEAVDFTMGDGTKINYAPGTIKYFGENVPYKVSSETTYTFVGSYYKSQMPVNCYFLGWDSRLNGGKGGAAFWYNKNTSDTEWNWNNETGIIIPNFNTSTEIHDATGSKDPARWMITGLTGDDIKTPAGSNGAKKYSMLFGDDIVNESGDATGINEMSVAEAGENSIYNLKGEKVGSSLRSLPKGVYIKNGNKYVVK